MAKITTPVTESVVIETVEEMRTRFIAEFLASEKAKAEEAARAAAAVIASEKLPEGVPPTTLRTPVEFRTDLAYAKAQAMLSDVKGDKATDLIGPWSCPSEVLIRDGKGLRYAWKSSDLKGDQFMTASGAVPFWRHGSILSAKGAETKTKFLVLPVGRTRVTLFDLAGYMAEEASREAAEAAEAARKAEEIRKAAAFKAEQERMARYNAALENLSKTGFDVETLKNPGVLEALKSFIAAQ